MRNLIDYVENVVLFRRNNYGECNVASRQERNVTLLFKDASIGNAISISVVQLTLRNDDFSILNSQDV
ncbi:hypothetical protein NQ318_011257 [Aromia moschata]|uniref:Uncharacterized protein n=1 Tax=Aromia moschata TaxID=1265417 RepID=A0AAV8YHS8_9CUCU|nr:hypothetical protein NQ318_011257 [Aromia moschata]